MGGDYKGRGLKENGKKQNNAFEEDGDLGGGLAIECV